jgi:hypothetical protein
LAPEAEGVFCEYRLWYGITMREKCSQEGVFHSIGGEAAYLFRLELEAENAGLNPKGVVVCLPKRVSRGGVVYRIRSLWDPVHYYRPRYFFARDSHLEWKSFS